MARSSHGTARSRKWRAVLTWQAVRTMLWACSMCQLTFCCTVCKYHVSVASAYAPNVHCKSRPSFNCPSEVHNLLYAEDFTYIEYLRCLAAYLCPFFVLYPYHLSSNAPNVHSKCHLPFIVHLSGFTYIDYLRCQATYLCPFFCSLRWLCPLLSHVPLSIHFLFL
jgi:hypothetical protein